LTSAGVGTFDDVAPEHLANEEHLLAALRPEERQELARLLRILLVEFEQPARDRPDDRIGVRIAPAHVAQQRRAAVGLAPAPGLLVESVRAQSPAHAAKITPGDLLIEANGVPLQSLTCLARALPTTSGTVSVVVKHGTSIRTEAIAAGAPQADARTT
jgi:S1-C subfamily serine protease